METQAKYGKNSNGLAAGYVRVSTREQAESGLSLELQERAIRGYCRLNRLNLDPLISDPGESGKDLNRLGIRKLIDLCQERKVRHVVVYRLDRLTRRLIDLLTLQEDIFRTNGVELHSITEKIDTSTAVGKMYVSMIGAISEMERDLISERTREALAQKKIRGEPTGLPPYGYRSTDGVKYEECEAEMKMIKKIRRLRKAGKTYESISEILNSKNIPTKRGGLWYAATVQYVINNDNYKTLKGQSNNKNGGF